MDARAQILSNIRKGRSRGGDGAGGPLFGPRDQEALRSRWEKTEKERARKVDRLVEDFRRECEEVLGKVHLVNNHEELLKTLSQVIKEEKVKRVMKWDLFRLGGVDLDPMLDSLGIEDVFSGREAGTADSKRWGDLQRMDQAQLGISGADYGLADTGTLVLRAMPGQDRSTSLLPPVHVAILGADRILACSDDLILKLQLELEEKGTLDSCLTLITGPSKTADIELTLILGVHGPKVLHVILVKPA